MKALITKLGLMSSAVALSFVSLNSAAEVGLGISLQQKNNSVSIPIDISKRVRIEPMMKYSEENPWGYSDTNNSSFEYGAGFYAKKRVAHQLNFLTGIKLLAIDSTSHPEPELPVEITVKGIVVAPTVAFEYFIHSHVSIGGEVSLAYYKLDRDMQVNDELETDQKEIVKTETALNIRFYF